MSGTTGQKRTAGASQRSGKLIGYARVSTTDQDLAVQRESLKRAGVGIIFEEKASGTKRDGRTELQKVLSVLGEGDALVVTRLDRLGRSLRDLANIAHEIEQAGAHLKVLEQSVDTSSAAGRAFFGMLATFAAFETDVRRERQLEGIAMAKRQGVYKGGKRASTGCASRSCPRMAWGRQPLPASWGWPAAPSTGFSKRPGTQREHAATRPSSKAPVSIEPTHGQSDCKRRTGPGAVSGGCRARHVP